MRNQFHLPEADAEYLERFGLSWETVIENGCMRVIVYNFPLPDGYNVKAADLYLRIEGGYPDTQIDMAYFYPALSRVDGVSLKAITADSFDGKQWQRWSRHRTSTNPWRSGLDNIETHLIFVGEWLKHELTKV